MTPVALHTAWMCDSEFFLGKSSCMITGQQHPDSPCQPLWSARRPPAPLPAQYVAFGEERSERGTCQLASFVDRLHRYIGADVIDDHVLFMCNDAESSDVVELSRLAGDVSSSACRLQVVCHAANVSRIITMMWRPGVTYLMAACAAPPVVVFSTVTAVLAGKQFVPTG